MLVLVKKTQMKIMEASPPISFYNCCCSHAELAQYRDLGFHDQTTEIVPDGRLEKVSSPPKHLEEYRSPPELRGRGSPSRDDLRRDPRDDRRGDPRDDRLHDPLDDRRRDPRVPPPLRNSTPVRAISPIKVM
jgi:hypothetical protein